MFRSDRPTVSSSLPPLRTPLGLAASPASQLAAVSSYYSALFTDDPPSAAAAAASILLLNAVSLRLPPDCPTSLSAAFTLSELRSSLRSSDFRSSAGPDGIPYRVYLHTFSTSGPLLLDLANSLPSLSFWPVLARTILIPKLGDLSDLANYRPISVTNSYVRLISRMLSSRLLAVGDSLLPWYQSAFLPGRRSALVAGVLLGLTDLISSSSPLAPPPFFVLSLDQRKAYDRVSRPWLFAVLAHLRLPPLLLGVIRALYSSPHTRVHVLGAVSALIPLLRGVLQGDPSSCILYNLTLQPLFDLLTSRGVGVTVPVLQLLTALAFADDSLLFLEASPHGLSQWPLLLSSLRSYEAASGASLNLSKSSFWLVGTPSPAHLPAADALRSAILSLGLRDAGPSGPAVHLGHPLHPPSAPHLPSPFLLDRLAAIRTRAACFRTHGVDLLSRVRAANRFLSSRLWHTIAVGPLPPSFASLYFRALRPYLLGPKSALVAVPRLTLPPSLGGFGLLCPDAMATSLSISFLRRYLLDPGPHGAWLRAGLTDTLRQLFRAPPALLLLRRGPLYRRLRSPTTRARGFFGRLLHALAVVDLGLHSSWESLPLPALLTLPWLSPWLRAAPLTIFPHSRLTTLVSASSDWLTWGDVLWREALPLHSPPVSWTLALGPPDPRSVLRNGVPSPFSGRLPTDGPGVSTLWPRFWAALPAPVRTTLASASHIASFSPLRPAAPSTGFDSTRWVPLLQDPLASAFPWHLLTVNGHRLSTTSTSSVRRALQAAPGPRTAIWSSTPSSSFPPVPPPPQPSSPPVRSSLPPLPWALIWRDLAATPLTSPIRTASLLALGRNVPLLLGASAPRPCPLGCPFLDSPTHGLFTCPAALSAWTAAFPLLSALGGPAVVSLDPRSVVSGWPEILLARPRLLLWRSAVIYFLLAARRSALAAALRSSGVVDFRHTALHDFLSGPAALVAECLLNRWASLSRTPAAAAAARESFSAIWVANSQFVFWSGSALAFSPLGSFTGAVPSAAPAV